MKSMIIRIVKQIVRDKRSLAIIIVAPVFLVTLIYLLLGETNYVPKIVLENMPENIANEIAKQEVKIIDEGNDESLKDKKIDAIVSFSQGNIEIKMMEADSVKTPLITGIVRDALAGINKTGGLEISYIYGLKTGTMFEDLGYMFLGLLSFFFVFLLAGISFVRERTTGTLERLMLTPVKTSSVVTGYILGFGIFAIIQSVLIILYTQYVLGLEFVGSSWVAIVIMLMLSFVAVALGILVSSAASNEFQVMQFIPIIIVPQIFFSGIIPIDTLPYHLDYLSMIMPLYYGCLGLKGVLIQGLGLIDVLPYIGVLTIFIIVLYIANIIVIKKYRAI